MGKKKTKKTTTTAEPRTVGRPSLELDDCMQLRFTAEDRAQWQAAADKAGMKLSQWIRFQCANALSARVVVTSVEFKTDYHAFAVPQP